MPATLIADDLTGACDAGALFAGRHPVGVFLAPASPGLEWNVAAVDTESRDLSPVQAAEHVRAAASRLKTRLVRGLVFKKIDSTLRGPVGAEISALLAASGRRTALVCPAFPGQERVVMDGTLLVGGVPAHRTPIAEDPAYPGPTSDVTEIIGGSAGRPVSFLGLAKVRGDRDELARAIGEAQDEVIVADAETDDDLDALASAALGCQELVLAGSAGLARAVARASGLGGPPVPLPEGRAWLYVIGSLHPATRAQLGALETAGVRGARLDHLPDPDLHPLIAEIKNGRPAFIATGDAAVATLGPRQVAARRLARVAARILEAARADLVVATGGETAVALMRTIGAARLELTGAPSEGLALGDAVIDAASTVPLLTKAGGFGRPDLLLALLEGPR